MARSFASVSGAGLVGNQPQRSGQDGAALGVQRLGGILRLPLAVRVTLIALGIVGILQAFSGF